MAPTASNAAPISEKPTAPYDSEVPADPQAPSPEAGADDPMHGALLICLTAAVAGAIIGFVGGAFRWLLEAAGRLRLDFVE